MRARRRRYCPRKGTMRGSAAGAAGLARGGPPTAPRRRPRARATTSAPRRGRRTTAPARRATPVTSAPSSSSAPAGATSAASAAATPGKSTMPVAGECSAAIPVACGSISARPAASTRRRPGTPLALPRRSSSSRRPSSPGVDRDDELAAALDGHAARLAVGVEAAGALDAELRLRGAGRVVDARVDDAGVVARLVRGDPGLAVQDRQAQARVAGQQLARGRQPDEAGAHDRDVVSARGGQTWDSTSMRMASSVAATSWSRSEECDVSR